MSVEFVNRFVPNLSDEAKKVINDTDIFKQRDYARKTSNQHHIKKIIQSGIPLLQRAVARNPNISSENIFLGLHDPDQEVAKAFISNENVKPEHLDAAFNNGHKFVVGYKNASNSLLDKGLMDSDEKIRKISANNMIKKKYFPAKSRPIDHTLYSITDLNHLDSDEFDKAKKTFNFKIPDFIPIKDIIYSPHSEIVEKATKNLDEINASGKEYLPLLSQNNKLSSEALLHLANVFHKSNPLVALQVLENKNLKKEHANQIAGMMANTAYESNAKSAMRRNFS